ncbi:MAG: corrinoid protein [Desulfobacteraceae bacterium]|nr:corrinoid protein [Desulfobacteraceae bacterium]
MSDHLQQIKEAIINGKHEEIEGLVLAAISEGVNIDRFINVAMIAALDVVGQRFTNNEIFIPEMLAAAVSMKKGLNIIKPYLKGEEIRVKGTIIICTVKGDIHDIGKNMVIMMLEGAGFRVHDLGVDISAQDVIKQVKKLEPNILGLSALLTTTMPEMKKIIEALESEGLRKTVKVIVGGAPVDIAFAERIGADGYGKDAAEAVQLARRLTTSE